MTQVRFHRDRLVGWAVVVVATILMLFLVTTGTRARGVEPQRRSQKSRSQKPKSKVPQTPRIDYTKFSHQTHAVTQKLACNSCHKVPAKNWKEVRKGDAAFPDVTDFPEHATCLGCHRQQFFARERPAPLICSNCHIAVSPRDTSRWLFPSLGDVVGNGASLSRNSASAFRMTSIWTWLASTLGSKIAGGW